MIGRIFAYLGCRLYEQVIIGVRVPVGTKLSWLICMYCAHRFSLRAYGQLIRFFVAES